MEQTIVQIGNSVGIIIPKSVKSKFGLNKGDKVYLNMSSNNASFIVSKSKGNDTSITPDFLRIMATVNEQYGPALKKLAKL